jgi:hypothetical protein
MDLVYLAGIALFFALIAGLIAGCYKLGVPSDKQGKRS